MTKNLHRAKLSPYLKVLIEKDGSDVYLSTGARPGAKFSGVLTPLSKDPCPIGYVDDDEEEDGEDGMESFSLSDDEQNASSGATG